jgi:hypothetical protein
VSRQMKLGHVYESLDSGSLGKKYLIQSFLFSLAHCVKRIHSITDDTGEELTWRESLLKTLIDEPWPVLEHVAWDCVAQFIKDSDEKIDTGKGCSAIRLGSRDTGNTDDKIIYFHKNGEEVMALWYVDKELASCVVPLVVSPVFSSEHTTRTEIELQTTLYAMKVLDGHCSIQVKSSGITTDP